MRFFITFYSLLPLALAYNFPWESVQLTEAETHDYPEIRFANASNPLSSSSGHQFNTSQECRTYPGDADWPTEAQWARFNETLGGALLKPVPLAAVCYKGQYYDEGKCTNLKRNWDTNVRIHADDPTSIMLQWGEGNTCLPQAGPNSTCTQGGFPVYVVNATTVKHIQLAVNFARNQNIRLVIKNTGHDFNGKSSGAGALSIWTHNLKSLTYHPTYNYTSKTESPSLTYASRAVSLSAGIESFDLSFLQYQHNFSMVAPGGPTVGALGGFMLGGGHSGFTSYWGLATDQVIELNVVTADGRYKRASFDENEDLFWALRGGGGGTFGVVVSGVMKAHQRTPVTTIPVTLSTGPAPNITGFNLTFPGNWTGPVPNRTDYNFTIPGNFTLPAAYGLDRETFWKGVYTYWRHCIRLGEAGGIGYNFIRNVYPPNSNATYLTFQTSFELAGMSQAEAADFVSPFFDDLEDVGISIARPSVQSVKRSTELFKRDTAASPPTSLPPVPTSRPGDTVGSSRLASRLIPRSHFEDPDKLSEFHVALRRFVEKGRYTFHGINYTPTDSQSGGYPWTDNALNPAFRDTVMHCELFDTTSTTLPVPQLKANYKRFRSYVQIVVDTVPEAGGYMNEGDVTEDDWQDVFYGYKYDRLLMVKRQVDPWDLFYVGARPGSEGWEVRSPDFPEIWQQNGRLCKVREDSSRKRV